MTEMVATQNSGNIPAGSNVDGVVARVTPRPAGHAPCCIWRPTTCGRPWRVGQRESQPVVADQPALATGAIAAQQPQALIGHAVGDGKGAAVEPSLVAAPGVVAESEGCRVVPNSFRDGLTVDRTVMR